jgi:hypothetical protein
MSLRFRCERCGKRLQVEEPLGSNVLCPHCRQIVTVPADAQAVEGAPAGEAQAAAVEDSFPRAGDRALSFVATYLPSWGTSMVVHLSLVLLALTTYTALAPRQTALAPRVELAPTRQRDMPTESKKHDLTRPSANNSTLSRSLHPENRDHGQFTMDIHDSLANERPELAIIGVGPGNPDLSGVSPDGLGRDNMNRFGNNRGGPKNEIFPSRPLIKRIAFVVDRSGSMTDSIMYVKVELKRAISSLRPSQEFYIAFYSSGPALELPARRIVPATEANKQAAYEFIDSVVAFGQTDPSDALKKAFEQKPELVYLLTDGEFEKSVVTLIDKLNPQRQTTVSTIGFLYTPGEETLKEIAAKNTGNYKFVGEDDLSRIGQ